MLGVLASIYGRFIERRNRHFDDGTTPIASLPARTISIGNLTTGGTGKTPLVIKCAEILAGRGKRVCILTRGYGRKSKGRVLVSNGREILEDVLTAGDEPVEMANRLLKKAVVVADADRAAAAAWTKDEFGVNVFVLDDAFQHRQAARDVNIVCIDATDPFGGGKLLPAGRLREPVESLSRADAVVITRAGSRDLADIKAEILRVAPSVPIFEARAKIVGLRELRASVGTSIAHKKGFAFCGIGSPENFFSQLERENYDLAGRKSFRDHHKYAPADVKHLEASAGKTGASYFLTTAKDAVKLAELSFSLPVFIVDITVVIDREKDFAALL
ncbi:MAG TPA: tetraacyldisaccharide 4'-kinase [Pyrinomonadaceae bacterium]|nr:tetraacyldisaccharide 4'-kinase [Pyrinomonadaceae bacterium]